MSVLERDSLLDRLPRVRGRLTANAPLGPQTWFRVGGKAEILFKPADRDDLAEFLAAFPRDIPLTMLGCASNVLVRDGGIPGVVIRLTGFSQITADSEAGIITAEAGALDATVAQIAQEHALTGLEFLSGIPGNIGGAVVMNAGCYGSELGAVLVDADLMLRGGTIITLTKEHLALTYRHSALPPDSIVLSARLRGTPGDPAAIASCMAEVRTARTESQPTRARTGGSTFANPPGRKAWELIDAAGCRGLTIGGAQMSPLHCNFMLNTGSATAADLETLGEEVRTRVFATSGILLDWEIKLLGKRP